ncbi:MAG: phage major capsid protein, partial [Shimia sp.]|nr:phage major capsid protein [Shimia sp.]
MDCGPGDGGCGCAGEGGDRMTDFKTPRQIAAIAEAIRAALNATVSLRQIARVVNVEATAYDVLIDRTAETGTPTIERITIPLHELSALPKVSQRLLDDSAFDIESWLSGRIA